MTLQDLLASHSVKVTADQMTNHAATRAIRLIADQVFKEYHVAVNIGVIMTIERFDLHEIFDIANWDDNVQILVEEVIPLVEAENVRDND